MSELETGTNEAVEMPPPNPRTYMFDAPELKCEIDWGQDKVLELTYTKPEDQDHLDYEEAVQRTIKVVSGESTDETDAEPANEEYFNKLAVRMEKKVKGTTKVLKAYEHDETLRIYPETKNKFVAAMGGSTFEVIQDEDDEDAGLIPSSGEIKVLQVFDSGKFDPITYTVAPLEKIERKDFTSAWKPSEKAEDRKSVIRTTKSSGIKKGMKWFKRKIVNVEGGLIGAGTFSADTKDEYIKQIDKAFQMLVIDAVVAAAGKAPK